MRRFRRQLWRIRLAWDLWLTEDYDGEGRVGLLDAWRWAGCVYPWRLPVWWHERSKP